MTPKRTKRSNLHLRLDDDLAKRLTDEAAARDLSLNYLAGRLLAEGLERLIPVDELILTRPRLEVRPIKQRPAR